VTVLPGRGRRVLVVDDAAELRMLIRIALADLGGFVVEEAPDAATALALLRAGPPDAVVLDVQLPDLDGPELLALLRAEGIDVPVVFLTATGSVHDGELEKLDARGVLHKPFEVDQLAARLAAFLEQ
jgi:DNA-binding response OmpR family regulator